MCVGRGYLSLGLFDGHAEHDAVDAVNIVEVDLERRVVRIDGYALDNAVVTTVGWHQLLYNSAVACIQYIGTPPVYEGALVNFLYQYL